METLVTDVRYAVRMLRKSPGFAAVAVTALALGIGANTAIFSVVNAVLLSPLPYAEPGQLVVLTNEFQKLGFQNVNVSVPEYRDYLEQGGVFEGATAIYPVNINLTGVDEPERIQAMIVSPSFFDVLGVAPELGRTFQKEDEHPGIAEVAVISHGLWQRRFGGDPGVLGRRLRLDDDDFTVVGVMPAEFRHPGSTPTEVEIWVPSGFSATPFDPPARKDRILNSLVARLAAGATPELAQRSMDLVAARLQEQHPDSYPADAGFGVRVAPLHDTLVGNVRPALLVLLGAVGLVLLIACANVANLLLARAAARQKEVAVRLALGAGRARLVRQFLTESVLLALAGGALGLVLALWGIDALLALSPPNIPGLGGVGVDGAVLAFTLATSLLTGVAFGIVPALQTTESGLHESLKEGGRSATGARRNRLSGIFVVSEFALALVLLIGAGLLIRSFWRLQEVAPGFDPRNVLTAEVWLPTPNQPDRGRYFAPEKKVAFARQLLERVRALPGVEYAGLTTGLPLGSNLSSGLFTAEGRETLGLEGSARGEARRVTPDYFRAMGIPLLSGRAFTESDDRVPASVAVVGERLARRIWPGEDPLGKRLKLGGPTSTAPWLTVVGVVGDVKSRGMDVETPLQIYIPFFSEPNLYMALAARTNSDPAALTRVVAEEARAIDGDQPVYNVRTMEQALAVSTAQRRFSTLLLGIFAGVALVLAAVGIYGVMAYAVSQRTREIGVRMALGARPGHILRLVVGGGMAMALAGVAAGLAAAFALTRVMAGLLFDVSATDPLVFGAISILLVGVALLACYVPARRAARVDPLVALRTE
jgi:putative ABC transport system permease protein